MWKAYQGRKPVRVSPTSITHSWMAVHAVTFNRSTAECRCNDILLWEFRSDGKRFSPAQFCGIIVDISRPEPHWPTGQIWTSRSLPSTNPSYVLMASGLRLDFSGPCIRFIRGEKNADRDVKHNFRQIRIFYRVCFAAVLVCMSA